MNTQSLSLRLTRLLDHFSVRRVVMFSNVALIAGVAILCTFAWYGLSQLGSGLDQQFQSILSEREIHRLLSSLIDTRTAVQSAMLLPSSNSVDNFKLKVDKLEDALHALYQSPSFRNDTALIAVLENMKSDTERLKKNGLQVIELAIEPEAATPAYGLFDRDLKPAYQVLAQKLWELEERDWQRQDMTAARRTHRAIASLNSMMVSLTSYLLTRDRGMLTEVWVNSRSLNSFAAAEANADPEITGLIEVVRKDLKHFDELTLDALTIHQSAGWRRDMELFSKTIGPAIEDMTQDIDSQVRDIEKDSETLMSTLSSTKQRILLAIAAATGIAVMVVVLVFWLMKRNVLSRLTEAVGAMREIEHSGNLHQSIRENGKDELAALASSFNKFVAKIRSVVNLVLECSSSLANESQLMVESGRRARDRVNQQELTINKVADSVSVLVGAVQSIRDSTDTASAAASRAQQDSQSGQEIVGRSISAIQSLSSEVGQIDSVIARIVIEAKAIEDISTAIREISEQTNLLALNAAIEAARAGESGRGFAVVADEVRTLALKTRNQTNDINQKLTRLRSEVEHAVQAAKVGLTRAGECNEMALQAGNALSQINDSVQTITDLNTTVAAAVQEQSRAFAAVNEDVISIREIATETVASAADASRQSGELRTMASQLKDLVSQFLLQNGNGNNAATASAAGGSSPSATPGDVDLF